MRTPPTVLLKVFRCAPAGQGPATTSSGCRSGPAPPCSTPLDGLGDPVVVEPLAGMPVMGDLVVDMEGLYRRLEPAGRPLVPASEGARPELDELERFEDCLECGLCLSAC
jgi:succinate dehydrogenase/fumarate reductase-like Fe-S protein